MKKKNKQGGPRRWPILLAALLILTPAAWLLITMCEGSPPQAKIEPALKYVGLRSDAALSVSDEGRGLRHLKVTLRQGDAEAVVLEKNYPYGGFFKGGEASDDRIEFTLEPRGLAIADGAARLEIRVTDYSWRRRFRGNAAHHTIDVMIDTRPPRIAVMSRQHNIAQGGSGLVVYRVSEPVVQSGVMAGERFFPGYAGYFSDPAIHMAFFALSHENVPAVDLYISAEDLAGNTSRAGFDHYIRKRQFKKDRIVVSDAFLNRKMPEFETADARLSGPTPFETFLRVNRDLRVENDRYLLNLWRKTAPTILWEGVFLQLPNAANRAGFADHREYIYNGKLIDTQFHLGVDMASLATSPVPAANRGIVLLAEYVGIYGNTIVLDHGFGLLSLYSHLSSYDVGAGQTVEKGDIIGRTGATGLAGGDHLHFSMIVHDMFVEPLEWWDASWIKNNITSKIDAVHVAPDA